MIEVFIKGQPYIERSVYDQMRQMGHSFRHVEYVLSTRKPVEGLYEFILENKERIENINVNFERQSDRANMRQVLNSLPETTITSSFPHNLEIGGATTSKAAALLQLESLLGVSPSEMMAIGDSPNDIAMMQLAGTPVAVANAGEEVKAIAKYITSAHHQDGVAQAIRKFALNKKG